MILYIFLKAFLMMKISSHRMESGISSHRSISIEKGGKGFGSASISATIYSSVFGAFSRLPTERDAISS